ncbi:MAG: lipid-A-disaccharide synthase [Gammaproteobacteria bacterium]|nr:MAG: lipid-A-disaccharide synthase [Gammaproteobacteria bacterium]
MVIVGEASGDAHAARMITQLKQQAPEVQVNGIGGKNMRAAGANILVDFSELAVMGLVEVLKRYRTIKKIFNQIVTSLKTDKPDLLVLVDYPGFNLKLAKQAKKLGIPVLYYISPKVWAWRAGRVKTIKQVVDHMAVLFPFEQPIYQQAGVPVTCVGHPLVDAVENKQSNSQAKTALGIDDSQRVLGLFPGSRKSEVEALLPIMLQAAEQLSQQDNNLNVIVPLATGLDKAWMENILSQSSLEISLVEGDFYQTTKACDAIVAASGTVTLEIALLGVPHFIIYRVAPLTYQILRRLVKIPYVGLCNIVTGKPLVLELLQDEVTVDRLDKELTQLLTDPKTKEQAETVRQQVLTALGPAGGAGHAAQLVISMLEKS